MNWFLYDRDLRHERVKRQLFAKVVNLSRSDPGRRVKINLNFYFHTSFHTQALKAFPS